jgi:hypothetical protein
MLPSLLGMRMAAKPERLTRNLRLGRGRPDFDRGHVFTAIVSYPLPPGRGRLLVKAGKLTGGILGGCVLSCTVTAYTGPQSDRPDRIGTATNATGAGKARTRLPWYAIGALVPTVECDAAQFAHLTWRDGKSSTFSIIRISCRRTAIIMRRRPAIICAVKDVGRGGRRTMRVALKHLF